MFNKYACKSVIFEFLNINEIQQTSLFLVKYNAYYTEPKLLSRLLFNQFVMFVICRSPVATIICYVKYSNLRDKQKVWIKLYPK